MITQPVTYLFIDGAHLRHRYSQRVERWFGMPSQIQHHKIKQDLSANKAFYYDCVDDIQKQDESDQDFEARVRNQEEALHAIRSIDGFHIREGFLSRSRRTKKREQKGVDVLLAVEMMNHAFRSNMDVAVLLSGDSDFKPLVESLIHNGIFVHIACDPLAAASDFMHCGDAYRKLDLRRFYDWAPHELQKRFPLPDQVAGVAKPAPLFKKGLIGSTTEVFLYKFSDVFMLEIPAKDHVVRGAQLERLELYCELEYGSAIHWA